MLVTNPDTASGGTGTSGTGGTPASGSGGASTSGSGSTTDVVINPRPFTPDLAWPTDLLLDRHKSNWEEWDRRLNLIIDQRNFFYYLDGSFPCPDPAVHPNAALNWRSNDRALRAFILEHVSDVEYDVASLFTAARDVYDALRKMHENFGQHPQVHIVREALDVRFSFAAPLNLSRTLHDIDRLHDKFIKMGKMDDDKLKIIFIMNALKTHPQLQYTIDELLESSPTITSADIEGRILREEQLLRHRENKLGLADNTALAAVANKTRPICANCKRSNHRSEFCVAPGGNMAGKTIDEARAAQKAAAAKSKTRGNRNTNSQSANVTQTPTSTKAPKSTNTITIDGKRYTLVSDSASTATPCGAATPRSS